MRQQDFTLARDITYKLHASLIVVVDQAERVII
jgi:hypothetical protein